MRGYRVVSKCSVLLLASLVWCVGAQPLAAQRVNTPAPDTTQADSLRGPSPRGAFIRSLAVPGWGQAAVGSYGRGAFWFGIQSTSWYMLFRTIGRLDQAKQREERRVIAATDSLNRLIEEDPDAADRLADPIAFEEAVAANARVAEARALIDSRRRHRQDWITYTLFFTMMSGVDAYVNAHLRDFPAELSTQARDDGSVGLRISVPLGTRR